MIKVPNINQEAIDKAVKKSLEEHKAVTAQVHATANAVQESYARIQAQLKNFIV